MRSSISFLPDSGNEYEALQRSGYAGEGFYSKGHRLGENVSHDLPPHLARVRALEAAEKRRRAGMLSGWREIGRTWHHEERHDTSATGC